MMKNKKSRSVIFRSIKMRKGISELENLRTNISTVENSQEKCPPSQSVVTYYPGGYPIPNKKWSEYLTERPIVDGNSLKLKFRNTPSSKPNIEFVIKNDNVVKQYSGISVRVFFIPKDKKIEDMVIMLMRNEDECIASSPFMIGGEEVVEYTTTYTYDTSLKLEQNMSLALEHNVKNNGYSVGSNTRLYIRVELDYRLDIFAFYVD